MLFGSGPTVCYSFKLALLLGPLFRKHQHCRAVDGFAACQCLRNSNPAKHPASLPRSIPL
jgi:hypothetical protein